MKCTTKEQETCDVEKMGCEGCAYNKDSVIKEIAELENKLNQLSKENNLMLQVTTTYGFSIKDGKYTTIRIDAYKELI